MTKSLVLGITALFFYLLSLYFPAKNHKSVLSEPQRLLFYSYDDLKKRFHHSSKNRDCDIPPPVGYIRVLYSDADNGCGYFRAAPSEAQAVLEAFDRFETIPGVAVYKSTGSYPFYTQRGTERGGP